MKTNLSLIALCIFVLVNSPLKAQLIFDTINTYMAGPGTKITLVHEVTKPWSIQIMEVDLTNPYITIQTVKALDKIEGLEKTSTMALRKSTDGHKVIGAINGDFFSSNGTPINTQIINGEMLKTPIAKSTLGFSNTKNPVIQMVAFSGKIISKSSTFSLDDINCDRGENQLILYNPYKGATTNTNAYGIEWVCTPITDLIMNDTVRFTVGQLNENEGNTVLEKGKFVLSGHGSAATFLATKISQGDTLALLMNLGRPSEKLINLIGGFPQIIKDGLNYVDEGFAAENGPSHTYERHPRTAVGYSYDGAKLYLVTVDGRQENSIGMTLDELADYMLTLNIYQAINFDGGGSTTMVANNKIVNSPSDYSGERNVANALMVVSSAPEGSLYNIKIQPNQLKMRFGSQQFINLSVYDEFETPIPYDTANVDWKITNSIGILDENGVFWASGSAASGYISASYLTYTDSILVTIVPIDELTLTPSVIATDSIVPVEFKAITHNLNTTTFELDRSLLTWSVDNETIGTFIEPGIFKGKQNGTTQVTAKMGEVLAYAEISVDIFSETLLIDNFDEETWMVSSSFFDSLSVSTTQELLSEGTGAYKIDYQFTYENRSPYFTLHKEIPILGIPDSIWTDAKFDGKQYRLSYNLSTQTIFNNLTYSEFISNSNFQAVGAALVTKPLTEYPYILKELKVEIWKNESYEVGKTYSGIIYLDNLRVSFPGHSPIMVTAIKQQLSRHVSIHIFPVPSSQRIEIQIESIYNIDVSDIGVYSIDGKKISLGFEKTGVSNFSTSVSHLTKGVYFINIQTETWAASQKFLVD